MKTFRGLEELVRHVDEHHPAPVVGCNQCGQSVEGCSQLVSHLKQSHGINALYCGGCQVGNTSILSR